MNIYEKLQSRVDMPEEQIYQELYQALIVQDKMDFLGLILQRSVRLFADDTALICQNASMSYRELYRRACYVSRLLRDKGVKPSDRVLMLLENSFAFYVAYFGITQMGAVVVPLNIFLHERELAHIIQDSQAAFFICSSAKADKVRECAQQLPPMIDEHDLKLEEVVPDLDQSCEVTRLPFDDMAALLYTSGTTGFPKGVMLSSRNILTNVIQVIARFGLIRQQRILAVLPLFHSLAQNVCVWSSILMGCTVIIVPKIDRRMLLTGLEHRPTIFVGVPALFAVLCLLKTAPIDSVDYFFSGGDALPDRIRSAFSLIYRRKICSGYGTTEASPVISVDMEDIAEPTNCTGKPLIGVDCVIKDDDWNTLPANHIGQIWVRGDNIMLGYYNAPDVNKTVFKDGWFATGDLGYIDGNKKIVITGRVKDLIVSKGINIYPQEIENVILLSPNVTAVGVVGQDDPDVGQIPVAYVTVRQMSPHIELELRKLCAQHLASYKIPKQFICSTQSLATTATGKVDKKVLREMQAAKVNKVQ